MRSIVRLDVIIVAAHFDYLFCSIYEICPQDLKFKSSVG
jgi:hypothetical protein